jgi:hypothetical protein
MPLPRNNRAQLTSVLLWDSLMRRAGAAAMTAAVPSQCAPAQELLSYCSALREVAALVQVKDRFKSIIGRPRAAFSKPPFRCPAGPTARSTERALHLRFPPARHGGRSGARLRTDPRSGQRLPS